MLRDASSEFAWPELDYGQWSDTCTTLQLMAQIVGKVRLACTPWVNHSWHVALYLTARGLGTSLIQRGDAGFELELDLIDHKLSIRTTHGAIADIAITGQSIADFYGALMKSLAALGISVVIDRRPNEMAEAVAFDEDVVPRIYDADAANRFWRVLVQADRLLKVFRSGFVGKASPVHFFWGSFDLAVTCFSSRTAPPHPGGMPHLPDAVAREAYSHEVSSAGFWPGNGGLGSAAFYAYAYPVPPGFADHPVRPEAARYDAKLGEFLLPYDAVRASSDPDATVLDFLQTTYEAAAVTGRWDRAALER